MQNTQGNDAPGIQTQDHCEIRAAFAGPDIADVSSLFSIGFVRIEIPAQQVWHVAERVMSVSRHLVFADSDYG